MGSLESRDELFYFEPREKVSNVGEEGSSISVIDGFILFLFFFSYFFLLFSFFSGNGRSTFGRHFTRNVGPLRRIF